jgi:hypothetical protein
MNMNKVETSNAPEQSVLIRRHIRQEILSLSPDRSR